MKRPRLWETAENVGANKIEIAFHLGMSVAHFDELRPQMEREGMPKPDPLTGTWCVPAVDHWWRIRHMVKDEADEADDSDVRAGVRQWAKSA